MIATKFIILKLIRYLLKTIFGIKNLEKTIVFICRLLGINLLNLAYNNIGILNYQNCDISGENLVINKILSQYFNSQQSLFFFDIGANTGSYSTKLRQKFKNAIIYAFEPNKYSFDELSKIKLDFNIKTYNLGLSSKSCQQKIYTYADEIKSQHASF
ncbi:class I SAM-dependent methyltransferase [Stanieria cyanosphaera]|uniref:hypothetical protein n=1 Tax=Stanieria cyanosphaera TaxID=102116 RepID=UPI0005A292C9|nr:hypothetical protein [Stanieria cyanosphaera]